MLILFMTIFIVKHRERRNSNLRSIYIRVSDPDPVYHNPVPQPRKSKALLVVLLVGVRNSKKNLRPIYIPDPVLQNPDSQPRKSKALLVVLLEGVRSVCVRHHGQPQPRH